MDYQPARALIGCLPRTAWSKSGRAVSLLLLDESLQPALRAMYLAYQPRNSFQGLPPPKDAACTEWVERMIATGRNIAALSDRGELVGHAVLFPIDGTSCEMFVVVSPGCQNVGIGTELTRSAADLAWSLGYQRLRLSVEARNLRARHVYTKCGFAYDSDEHAQEREMSLDLRTLHPRRYTRLFVTNRAKWAKERSYVASASAGKKHPGSCLARR